MKLKEILEGYPKKFYARDVAAPQCSRETYRDGLTLRVAALLRRKGLTESMAADIAEAVYFAYQLGATAAAE